MAAALSAARTRAERDRPLRRITLIDKASEDEAGGNRWSPSYMRMAAPDRVETSFVHDMLAATRFEGDETYLARLAADAPATVAWIASHGVGFLQPTYYLAKGPPRIQPSGGGPDHKDAYARCAARGCDVRYGCAAHEIAMQDGRYRPSVTQDGATETLAADAVVLRLRQGFRQIPR